MKRTLLISALFTAGLSSIGQVHAACTGTITTVDISMAVGRVVVRPSDAVGKILRKATFPINPNSSTVTCNSASDRIFADLSQNYPLSALGDNIYSTNIPGIGIRLYREAENATNFSGYYPYSRSVTRNQRYTLAQGYFVVEIVKTAPQTGSGTLVPGRYSTYYFTGRASNPLLTSTVYGNAITIASSSCEILGQINKSVQLPTVNTAGFSGVGSTQGEQAFDLNILCNGGENPTGYEEKNVISVNFDYVQDGNNNQVLSNTAPAATRANGVGIQLLSNYKNNNKIIGKGDNLALGTIHSNQTDQYNIPLTARYYQTANNVSAGVVRAMATVTIQYD